MIKVDKFLYVRGAEGNLYQVTLNERQAIDSTAKLSKISTARAADLIYSMNNQGSGIRGTDV